MLDFLIGVFATLFTLGILVATWHQWSNYPIAADAGIIFGLSGAVACAFLKSLED